MIATEKLIEILRGLLEKSRHDQVAWQQDDEKNYYVIFPESIILISYESPSTEPDRVVVSIGRRDGERLKTQVFEEGSAHWRLASDLYSDAERCVTGWDKVLTDLEESIKREGVIGLRSDTNASGNPKPGTEKKHVNVF